ncbi:hypothetical protein CEC48_18325 [Pseudomonas sp. K2I15]|nr:hypothetical protein CEC48_18325 [Pseudomonas sp. K2I15]
MLMAVTLFYCCSGLYLYVGASLLAKNFRTPRSCRMSALSLTFFASKLAPAKCCSELFIVNPPVVQLFRLTCSFLFRGERPFCLTR